MTNEDLNLPHVLRARVKNQSCGGWGQPPQSAPNSGGDLSERIEELSALASLSDWEREFVGSIGEQHKKRGSLSPRQIEILEKIEKKNSPEAIAASANWYEEWDAKKREILEICAKYYRPTGYFTSAAHDALNIPDYIPSEKLYRKMCENKYAKRVLAAHFDAPVFPVGSMVAFRSTAPYALRQLAPSGQAVVLRTNAKPPTSPAKGAKIYEILPVGGSRPTLVEERYLKKNRKKKK